VPGGLGGAGKRHEAQEEGEQETWHVFSGIMRCWANGYNAKPS
jgi:hypothetical protein